MIVCDKFDEDFACIVRVRSQIDLLTEQIIHLWVIFVKFLPWDNIFHALRKLIEQIKMIFNVPINSEISLQDLASQF